VRRGGRDSGSFRGSLDYMQGLMRAVGVLLEPPPPGPVASASEQPEAQNATLPMVFRMCGDSVGRLMLLGVVGNFVTSPSSSSSSSSGGGAASSQPASSDTMPSVVIDAYTGRLEMVGSLSVMRAYFLETMLIISILAIARLALVHTVTRTTTADNADQSKAGKEK
jgi:hypothetical protein